MRKPVSNLVYLAVGILLCGLGGCAAVTQIADETNHQTMDELCQESDAVLAELGNSFDKLSSDQLVELSELSSDQRKACNERDGEAIVWLSDVERINRGLNKLKADIQ